MILPVQLGDGYGPAGLPRSAGARAACPGYERKKKRAASPAARALRSKAGRFMALDRSNGL